MTLLRESRFLADDPGSEPGVPAGYRRLRPGTGWFGRIGTVWGRPAGERGLELGLQVLPHHLNSLRITHGGFLVTFADGALGINIALARDVRVPNVTVTLSTDFLASAREGEWLEARTTITRQGRRLVYAGCDLYVGDRHVLRSSGVFALQPPSPSTPQRTAMGQFVTLQAADGHAFRAYVATPAGTPRGALVVAPEIFGINGHIRAVADGYAADGYLAIAPALFDRAQRDYETGYSPEEIQAGIAVMQRVDLADTMKDVAAAVAQVASAGRVGIVGYCWGGTVAWVAAARVAGLAASVPYYGGGIPTWRAEQPKCPVMFQFGEQDQSPTAALAREVAAEHPGTLAHFYPAGHGFNCDQRGSYHAESAALARQRTLAFLAQHVG
jgi:carboxymethylenebutenolidase